MDDKQILAPNLSKIIDIIEHDRAQIAQMWIGIPTVIAIFKKHKISLNKFRDGFGIPIIEYFIGVVREEKLAGNCPIMSKLVNYLLDKHITPKEVFEVCMGFRKILIGHMYDKKLVSINPKDIMDEVADIFDANLAGVLDIFTDLYKKQQRYVAESQEKQAKLKQFSKIINFIHTKIIIASDGKIIMANKSFLEVIGASGVSDFYRGLQNYPLEKKNQCQGGYCIGNIDIWLEAVCVDNNSIDINVFNYKYNKEFTYNARVKELPDTSPKKYIISLNNVSKFLEENAQLKISLDYDQSTGLYNYVKFEKLLNEEKLKTQKANKKAALAVIDFPNLKKDDKNFKDTISNIANIIKKIYVDGMHIARIDDTRFALFIPMEDKQSCYDMCCSLFVELNSDTERVTFALSWFDASENANVSLLNVFSLIEKANNSQDKQIVTDFEDIKKFEFLEEQDKFISIIKEKKDLEMTTFFKELAIVSNNQIISINGESVVVKVSKKQLITTKLNEYIYFTLPILGNIKAVVKYLNEKDSQLTLYNFRIAKSSPVQRKMFRVKADEDLNADITFIDETFSATLIDLNIKYMALSLEKKHNLDVGSNIGIGTILSIKDKLSSIGASGAVRKIEKIGRKYKVVVECAYSKDNESNISGYISMRQMEIVKEIQLLSL